MNSGRNSLLLGLGVLILLVYLWSQSQNKSRGLVTSKNPRNPANQAGAFSSLGKLLGGLLGTNKSQASSPKGGGGSGAGSGGPSSGAGTAGGQKMCNAPPCGGNVFVGTDSSGNDIYQRPDGSYVYSDGSAATACDIATNACGLCTSAGAVTTGPQACCSPAPSCSPAQCQPQCVQTAQPCCNLGACGGCSGGGCFCYG